MPTDKQNEIESVSRLDGRALVSIPAEKAQAVLEFIATLEREDSDVSGYMISGGLLGGISGGRLAATMPTESGCVRTRVVGETDWNCCDTDTLSS